MLIEIQPGRQNTHWSYGTELFSSEFVFAAVWGNHQAPRYSSHNKTHSWDFFNLIFKIHLASRSITKMIDLKSQYSVNITAV